MGPGKDSLLFSHVTQSGKELNSDISTYFSQVSGIYSIIKFTCKRINLGENLNRGLQDRS